MRRDKKKRSASLKRPSCISRESLCSSENKSCCSSEQSCKLGEDSCCAGEWVVPACEIGPQTPWERRDTSFQIRQQIARKNKHLSLCKHPCNGDEDLYPNKIGNFSKGLPHNELGEVNLAAYNQYIQALWEGKPSLFENLTLGGTAKFVNPQASYAFDLMAPDPHQPSLPPAPAFASAEAAAETVELYWAALTRSVPFIKYDSNPLIQQAANELSSLDCFFGPKQNGRVTSSTLFRGNTPGDLAGPYVSQFLYKPIPIGSTPIEQKYRSPVEGQAFLTKYDEWLRVQNGQPATGSIVYDPVRRYISNGTDLGEFVNFDFTFQAALNAALILLGPGFGQRALSPENPYFHSRTQGGFVTFGAAHILDFTAKVGRLALESTWFNKWLVHRKLRPEALGGAVQNTLTGRSNYPINRQLLDSQAVREVFSRFGTYLLPQAYPVGSPLHPSYPGGHSALIGSGVTILKAFFNESFIIPDPVQASADGLTLVSYTGTPLTLGGELNKLAWNVSVGRNTAGIHYRSDAQVGLELGEYVAIGMLKDYCPTYNEDPVEFTFTKFDGTKITICCKKPHKKWSCRKGRRE